MAEMTPVAVEAKLIELVSQMTRAQQLLAKARDVETTAEVAHRRVKIQAFHSPTCPKVTRGGFTVADRDAWVEAQSIEEWQDFRLATTQREIAQDNLRTVLAIAEVVRSLGSSVRTAYSMAGTGER